MDSVTITFDQQYLFINNEPPDTFDPRMEQEILNLANSQMCAYFVAQSEHQLNVRINQNAK